MKKLDDMLENLKQLAKIAVDEVTSQENIEVDFKIFTLEEYYSSDVLSEYLKNNDINSWEHFTAPIAKKGFCLGDSIIIVVDGFAKSSLFHDSCPLVDLLDVSFRELGSMIQQKKLIKQDYYDDFVMSLENFIKEKDHYYYRRLKNKHYKDIIVKLYGILKTEEFLKEIPEVYEQNKKYIEAKKINYELLFNAYDFNTIFNKFHLLSNRNLEVANPIHEMLYQEGSNKFKDILTLKETFEHLGDKKTFYSILSTEAFINQLDFDNLSKEEITVMLEAVSAIYINEIKKRNSLEKYCDEYEKKTAYFQQLLNITVRINYLEKTIMALKAKSEVFSLKYVKKKIDPYNRYQRY